MAYINGNEILFSAIINGSGGGGGEGNQWCGEYVDGTGYKKDAIVSYEGNIYLCIKDLDDMQDPTNAEYWRMLNEEGETAEEWDGTEIVIAPIASVSLISFTIDGTEYEAEEGMTWLEWVGSNYAPDSYSCASADSRVKPAGDTYIVDRDGDEVLGRELIHAGDEYSINEGV